MDVQADEFQFLVMSRDGALSGPEVDNGLVSFHPDEIEDFFSVTTGCHWGLVYVETRELPEQPGAEDGWDDVAELSVECSAGLDLFELEGRQVGELVGEGGTYRVRVSSRGRSDNRPQDYQKMTAPGWRQRPSGEHYLIEVWPAPLGPPTVIREST